MEQIDSQKAELLIAKNAPLLLDFFATWCGPCRMLAPILEQFAAKHPEVTVCKVDVDEQGELAARFDIVSIPTLIAFRDGAELGRRVGLCDLAGIESLFGA